MKKLVRFALLSLAFMLSGAAFGQSNLPACRGTDVARWSNCIGSWTDTNGDKYFGEWKKGKQNGYFTVTYASGDKYVGELLDGMYNGQGTATWKDGEKYVGGFRNGMFNGYGTFTGSNTYIGEWKDGEHHGQGTHITRAGETYIGEWKEGSKDGQGIFRSSDGYAFIGEIKSSRRNGQGIFYNPDGSVKESGIYKDGELVTSQYIDPDGFARTAKNSAVLPANTAQRLDADKSRGEQTQREQEEKLKIAQPDSLAVQSGKRIALVMGNSKYIQRPLTNPINDADDISNALKSANFEVIDIREGTLTQMRTAVRQFGDRLLQNDVGLVYYAGHGIEVKGKNYLIPVNADIQRPDEIVDQSLDMALILEKMTTAGKGVNILIVDACREDPVGRGFRSTSKGLATMDAPTGTIIAYSTSPGRVAADGDGRNSPYTKALVKAMQTPNKPIEQVFKEVRRSVIKETEGQQTPWENTSLSGDFYFRVQK